MNPKTLMFLKPLAIIIFEAQIMVLLILNFISNWQGLLASVALTLMILLIKLRLFKNNFILHQNQVAVCLLAQAILVGLLGDLAQKWESNYIYVLSYNSQTIILIQYCVAYSQDLWKLATIFNIYTFVPELFLFIDSIDVELTPRGVILPVIVPIFFILNIIMLQLLPIYCVKIIEKTPNLIIKVSSIRNNNKFRILSFLYDQRFLVLDSQCICVHDQADLESLTNTPDSYKGDQLLAMLLNAKGEQQSHSLKNITYKYWSSLNKMNHAIEVKQNSLSLIQICQQLFKTNLRAQFHTIGSLDSNELNLGGIQVNIMHFEVDDQCYIALHLQELLEGNRSTAAPKNTLISMKSNDNISQQLLNNIFSSISHEFGTYLNCMLTLCGESMGDSEISGYIKSEYLQPIMINAELLRYILCNIRDFNSMMLQQFSLRLQEFSPRQMIEQILSLVSTQTEQRNIEVSVRCSKDILVYNDADRFKQIIYQLVSNAIRFTQNGVLIITAHIENELLSVSVTDTGIGMAPLEQERLWELLKDNRKMFKISQNSVGCGLGLNISNQIAKFMDVRNQQGLTFSSKQDVGSTFSFTISSSQQLYNETILQGHSKLVKSVSKLYYVQNQDQESHFRSLGESSPLVRKYNSLKCQSPLFNQSQNHQYQFQEYSGVKDQVDSFDEIESSVMQFERIIPTFQIQLKQQILGYTLSSTCCSRILIVDDEYFNIMSLQIILKKFKTKTDKAFNGREALKAAEDKAKQFCPHCKNWGYMLYFLDINMPVMDGLDTVRELKRRMNENLIPKGVCIANTGYSDLETKQKAMVAGMDFYLTKPIEVKELESYLKIKFNIIM